MATVTIGGRTYQVEVRGQTVSVDGHEYHIKQREELGYTVVTAGHTSYRIELPPEPARQIGMRIHVDHRPMSVEYEGRFSTGPAPRQPRAAAPAAAPVRAGVKGGVSAQIAGRVLKLKVAVGDAVKQGDVVLLLEAMKMENEIKAPAGGTVSEILVKEGDRVMEGQTLLVVS